VRRRVRAFADRERDDHPHLIPNLAPNLSKVPFRIYDEPKLSLCESNVPNLRPIWCGKRIIRTNPSYIRQRRVATSESKGGPDSLMAVQRKGAGTRVFRGLGGEPPIFKGKGL
jgi:hypothetical protein